jgi:hypothetical protein
MAGLQDISPMVSRLCVRRSVFAPKRAEAAAASQPACPPPITMTSNFMARRLGSKANLRKTLMFHVKQSSVRIMLHCSINYMR